MQSARNNWITMGRFGRLHGTDGWIALTSYSDPPTALFDYPPPLMCGANTQSLIPIRLTRHAPQQRRFIARVAGFSETNRAGSLINHYLYLQREQLPQQEDGYYWHDLIGMEVIHQTDQPAISYGTVAGFLPAGSHDVMRISPHSDLTLAKGKEILVPFVTGTVIQKVDLAGCRLIIDWPPEYFAD